MGLHPISTKQYGQRMTRIVSVRFGTRLEELHADGRASKMRSQSKTQEY